MGKISPVSAKYIVNTSILIEGVVEKPDVIGSVFGQTEGLLGADLELRELQRSGRIGRIEVELDTKGGKTTGNIIIPSSMDKTETVLIAAAMETIQRIGPCNAKVKVENVEDVRVTKRSQVIDRAKELLSNLTHSILPDSRDIKEEVANSVKVMEVIEYGKDRLPAGPAVDESDEVIVVEGRADVINLVKNDIKNCIALNGTNVPQTVVDLSKRKTITVFVDGDRGGDLIIKGLSLMAEIDFVCKAPDGKEVEEITKKEIHKALRGKVAIEQVKMDIDKREIHNPIENHRIVREIDNKQPVQRVQQQPQFRSNFTRPAYVQQRTAKLSKTETDNYRRMLDDLIGTRGAYILDEKNNILGKVPYSELSSTITSLNSVHAVVFDGMVTKDIVNSAEKVNVKHLVAMDSEIKDNSSRVLIMTNKDL